jgi:hypothetical protein
MILKFSLHFIVLIFFLFSIPGHKTHAGGVKGFVLDDTGSPVPGASIYIRESQMGTSTNNDGAYEIPLNPGSYSVVFQALGYSRQEFRVTVQTDKWASLDVEFRPVLFQIHEVRIYSGGEDPAYAMMRRAIGLAPYYLRQAKQYEAEVYLRGSLKMEKIPRIIRKSISVNDHNVKVGETYTAESVNKILFMAPDTFHHTVISSRSSFPGDDNTSPMGFITSSFYDPDDEMIISPLSPQAMRHYRFRYDGYILDGDVVVNRIRVIPRRKSQQLLEGDLYLVENMWNIHSLDLTLDAFYGKIKMRQIFAPVRDGMWLPVSHHFDIDASVMGIKAKANYVSSVKYKEVELNTEIPIPALLTSHMAVPETEITADQDLQHEEPQSRAQRQIETLMLKEDMSNREMMRLASLMEKENRERERDREEVLEIRGTYKVEVKKDSLIRDSLFWSSARPIPLTVSEQQSFAVRDSIIAMQSDSAKNDSLKSASRFKRVRRFVISGGSLPKDANFSVRYGGLVEPARLGFNAVDGWKYAQMAGFTYKQDSIHRMTMELVGGYAFASERFYGSFSINQNYLPLRRGLVTFDAGTGTDDYKGESGLAPLINMGASLFFKENYHRLYLNDYFRIKNEIDISNGFRSSLSFAWHKYSPVENNTNYSFLKGDQLYHSNLVSHKWANEAHFQAQKAFISELKLDYTPRNYYYLRNGRKMMAHSDYPTFTFRAEHGSGLFGSDADYLLLEGGAGKSAGFSFMPTFSWNINGGGFVRNRNLHFSNFKHFEGSTAPLVFRNPSNMLLLADDYETSTARWFVRANTTYSSPYLLLKYLPVLSNRLWNENLHLSYLHSPEMPHYVQTGYSISRIFMAGTIGVFAGFSEGNYTHWGLRVAFSGL